MLKNGDAPLKVLICAPMSRYSGYGSDGIDMAAALTRKGVDVYLQPVNVQPPLPQDVADLLTKHLEAPFDLMIHHVDPGALKASKEQRRACDLIVGWSMWEFSSLINLAGKSSFNSRVKNFDALLGYTEVSKDSFEGYAPKKLPIGVLQGGYNPELWPYVERDWSSPRFSFIMNGVMNDRKNPWVAIAAFQELKDEYPEEFAPAEFHIHTTVPTIPSAIEEAISGIRIHYKTFDDYEMHEFYKSGHVLLAPSKGEGKNLPALEMLSTGGSVIYTDWGGHTNWGSTQYAYPLKYELVPIGAARYPDCMWAEADKEDLKRLMLHCFRNREEVKRKGIVGAEFIAQAFSWDAVMDQFFRTLPEILPGKGHEVKLKYDEALREASKSRRRGSFNYA